MTPYRDGAKVIIDPTIKPADLLFGEVPLQLYKKIGTVKKHKYLAPKKCEVYEVAFEKEEGTSWFKETEIVVLMS